MGAKFKPGSLVEHVDFGDQLFRVESVRSADGQTLYACSWSRDGLINVHEFAEVNLKSLDSHEPKAKA